MPAIVRLWLGACTQAGSVTYTMFLELVNSTGVSRSPRPIFSPDQYKAHREQRIDPNRSSSSGKMTGSPGARRNEPPLDGTDMWSEALLEEILQSLNGEDQEGQCEQSWASCSHCYLEKYCVTGRSNRKLLHTAIMCGQTAVDQEPDNSAYTQLLAACFTERYWSLGKIYDLQDALEYNRNAVHGTQEDDPEYPKRLHNLATSYRLRYQRSGNVDDLMIALDQSYTALKKEPKDPNGLQNLAASLTELYWHSNNVEYLEQSLEKNQEAFQLTPVGCPEYIQRLQNLATSLRERYKAKKDVNDLDIAMECNEKAFRTLLAFHTSPAGYANCHKNITKLFGEEIFHLGGEWDNSFIGFAISDADCAASIQNLALSFKDRYNTQHNQDDLDKALEIVQSAVHILPRTNPRRHHCLQSWAILLLAKFRVTTDVRYVKDASAKYAESFESPILQYLWSLDAAQNWESIEEALHYMGGEEEKRQPLNLEAHAIAFDLLSDFLWMGNSLTARQVTYKKMQLAHTSSDALSMCIVEKKLRLAIEFAEKGSAMIFQQRLLLNKHSNKLLTAEHARALEASSIEVLCQRHPDPYKVAITRQRLLETIRGQPGLEKFLYPKNCSDLCQVSQNGPVIILNSHSRSCDAIILLRPASEPICINLQITFDVLSQTKKQLNQFLADCDSRTRGTGTNIQQILGDLLSLLQSSIVSPIYQVLELNGISGKRLWWCPLGLFTGLPLHAADTSDKFVQSYTPSLGVLLDAMKDPGYHSKPKIGVVGVSHPISGGHKKALSHVQEEVNRIVSIMSKNNVELDTLCGTQVTFKDAKTQLQTCTWMHFACHGVRNAEDPVKSSLQLYDHQLDLGSILQLSLPNPEFVFLAACQTAKGDDDLVNESLHLGGAFIAAGFKAAIGTMWMMRDEDGPVVAEAVYSHLFDEGRLKRLNKSHPDASDTAEALQIAVRKLRDSGVPYQRWMPFIHIGL
ncbi:CHAT domain-containing protein [Mycena vulgaris]|nr:CHAT domain-containing protein [Mycena vulgaris]